MSTQISDQLSELTRLRTTNPDLRVLFSVGGSIASQQFSDVILTSHSRQTFSHSVLALVEENDLDGVDIDWEFPSHDQRENFTHLLQVIEIEIRAYACKIFLHFSFNTDSFISV